MPRSLAAVLTLLLAACGHAPPAAPRAEAKPGPSAEFLLDAAASDLRAHGPAGPLRFRDVRFGRLTGNEGTRVDVLCGELGRAQEERWTPFATIRTDPYEQWMGAQAADVCRRAALEGGDLSSALQRRMAGPR